MTRIKLWLPVTIALVATLFMTTSGAAQPSGEPGPRVETREVGLAYYQDRSANESLVIRRTGPRSLGLLLPAVQFHIKSLEGVRVESEVWDSLLPADGRQRMRLDLRFFDEADALFGKVKVSGQTQAQFDNGVTWQARIEGIGQCLDVQCVRMELNLEMGGRLKRGIDSVANAFLNLGATAEFNRQTREWRFTQITTPGGDEVHAVGDLTIRVMPGDNISLRR